MHHSSSEQSDGSQHHGVKRNGCHGESWINRQHGRQGECVGQRGVRETEHGKTKQPANVLHITGGSADHLPTAGFLNPAGLLLQHLVKEFLAQLHLHLPPHTEHELTGNQPHHRHRTRQENDPAGLGQHIRQRKIVLKVVHHPSDLQGNGDAENVHHHKSDGAQHHRASVRFQVAADQIEAEGGHRRS